MLDSFAFARADRRALDITMQAWFGNERQPGDD
jgi:hypothetical protein